MSLLPTSMTSGKLMSSQKKPKELGKKLAEPLNHLENTTSLDVKFLEHFQLEKIGLKHINTRLKLETFCTIMVNWMASQLTGSYKTTRDAKYREIRRAIKKNTLAWLKNFECEVCAVKDQGNYHHFHHVVPSKKKFALGGSSHSFKKMLEESTKCLYLCAECHANEHRKKGDMLDAYDVINRCRYTYLQNLLGR